MLALFFVVLFILILSVSAFQEWKLKQQRDTIQTAKYMGNSLKGMTQDAIDNNPPRNRNSVGK